MIDIRRTSLHLICLVTLACGPEIVPADEAGSTTNPGDSGDQGDTSPSTDTGSETDTGSDTICGDGVVDPGEACDDANLADDDGCTASCEIGPCGFEWVLREPGIISDRFAGFDRVDGALEATTSHWGLGPVLTQVTRIAESDGAIQSTLDISDVIGDEVLVVLAQGPNGDRFATTDTAMSPAPRVLRISATLEVLWNVVVPNAGDFADLASGPAGQLAILGNIELDNTNRDVRVISLDPDDGSVLWSHDLGGPIADNGYSLDLGTRLTIDADGRVFVGFVEYLAWDTTAATVAAFAPDGSELWSTRAIELPGDRVGAQALAIGPDGTVYLTAQSWDDYFESYLVALAPATGSIEWIFDYDELPIERTWATALGVAASTDRVLTTGYWSYFDGDEQVVQAYAVGFELGGALVCIGTYDTYPPPNADDLVAWIPIEAITGSQGEFYLGGIVSPAFDNSNELFAARIR